jgi:hypothetical protein
VDTIDTAETIDRRLTFRVAEDRLDEARTILAKTNRKAARYGLPGYTLQTGELVTVPLYADPRAGALTVHPQSPDALPVGFRGFYDVEIVGEMPRFDGWTFVATLTYDEEAGVITRVVPGVAVDLTAHRARPADCDYCHKRRHRADTYVFLHTDGMTCQVGRSCLVPFAGIRVPSALGWLETALADLGDLEEPTERERTAGDRPAPERYGTLQLLTAACRIEQIEPYRSVTVAREIEKPSTIGLTFTYVHPSPQSRHDREWVERVEADTDPAAAQTKAAAVLAWAAALDEPGEYPQNLRQLAGAQTVTGRNASLLVSAIGGYNRAEGIRVEREQRAAAEHVGTPGEKITLTGEVVNLVELAGYNDWSPSRWLYLIRGEVAGRPALVKWIASRHPGLARGWTVTGTAKVKEHEVYGDRQERQTVVTHAQLERVEQQ